MSARTWCFTYNNPTESADELIAHLQTFPKIRACVFQKEQGEEGTPHYQGYLELTSVHRLAGMKKILATAHFEIRRGTRDQARAYCQKEESRVDGPWEFGDWPAGGQGQRTDLEALYKAARTKKTLLEVAEEAPSAYLRYYKAVQHVRQIEALSKPTRTTDLEVILHIGSPGCGKTRRCYDEAPDLFATPVGKQLWLGDYAGESTVLLDDFSGNLRLVDTLRMLDRYPIQMPIKGGHVWWCPNRIYITTNEHPRNWYNYDKRTDSYKALARRIHKVVQFHEDGEIQEFAGETLAEFF